MAPCSELQGHFLLFEDLGVLDDEAPGDTPPSSALRSVPENVWQPPLCCHPVAVMSLSPWVAGLYMCGMLPRPCPSQVPSPSAEIVLPHLPACGPRPCLLCQVSDGDPTPLRAPVVLQGRDPQGPPLATPPSTLACLTELHPPSHLPLAPITPLGPWPPPWPPPLWLVFVGVRLDPTAWQCQCHLLPGLSVGPLKPERSCLVPWALPPRPCLDRK